ncbi:MAG: hypothetical protein B6U94_03260 [Thermofilum sp. ex4484_79]|nr:MAG: hypothetical protein B6U94_03260 [Thermofilum sp. ex4484_79]
MSKDEIIIVVDDREEKSLVTGYLRELGVHIIVKRIYVGDYVISNNVVLERKTVDDFINSIIDKRLFEQAEKMMNIFSRPILIIEGDMEQVFSRRSINRRQVLGAVSTLVAMGISCIYSKDERDTAYILYSIAKRIQKEQKEEPVSPVKLRFRKGGKTIWDAQVNLIAAIPGISYEMAKKILKHFGCPRRFFKASGYELRKVDGLGEKRVRKIIEILDTKYKGL